MLARDDLNLLKHTPLYALHVALGGKMVPFAGYEMPVQYAPGVLREHLHTRAKAGLFDVSHMGQIALRAKSGRAEDAALALERLVPQDIVAVAPGRQRYAQFTSESGGILTAQDFADYTATETPPLNCYYHGYRIVSAPPPSAGCAAGRPGGGQGSRPAPRAASCRC